MKNKLETIALGGGCHWGTEAVFQSLKGVQKVSQGYVASKGAATSFSEAVLVYFNPIQISLKILLSVHLHTHKSTSLHSMRDNYRSAVYTFSDKQALVVAKILNSHQAEFEEQLITKRYPFSEFKPSRKQLLNYYYSNPSKPFCETFIKPKLQILHDKFRANIALNRLQIPTDPLS